MIVTAYHTHYPALTQKVTARVISRKIIMTTDIDGGIDYFRLSDGEPCYKNGKLKANFYWRIVRSDLERLRHL